MPIDLEPPPYWAAQVPKAAIADFVMAPSEVQLRCHKLEAATHSKPTPAGFVYQGCSLLQAGICIVYRVDDPVIKRHERAHCAGWPATHPR